MNYLIIIQFLSSMCRLSMMWHFNPDFADLDQVERKQLKTNYSQI